MSTIDPPAPPVKPTRRYSSPRRQEQARRTRDGVLDAALGLFVGRGYGSTTMDAVAAEAGVSVETVYKAFSTKAGLVRAIRDRALLGEGQVPAEERSDDARDRATDPAEIIEAWVALQLEVMPRVAPILLVVRSAAEADPTLLDLRQELNDARLSRMAEHARHLADRGDLRPGLSVREARDAMFALSSPELYDLLVLRQGWSPASYGTFVHRSLVAALLP
jgi:AcrR family transcriptional regulator